MDVNEMVEQFEAALPLFEKYKGQPLHVSQWNDTVIETVGEFFGEILDLRFRWTVRVDQRGKRIKVWERLVVWKIERQPILLDQIVFSTPLTDSEKLIWHRDVRDKVKELGDAEEAVRQVMEGELRIMTINPQHFRNTLASVTETSQVHQPSAGVCSGGLPSLGKKR